MKSRELLSIVLSLIMVLGVTAGSAFAQSDEFNELESQLGDFCDMSDEQKSDFFSKNPDLVKFDERLAIICEIVDEDEREDEMDALIDDVRVW